MQKINCILLVDDDPTTNFLNEELLEDLEVARFIHVAWNGQEALDFINHKGKFKDVDKETHPRPNLIFLDINMPLMGGYEFLDQYSYLPQEKKAEAVIVFLTTSSAQEDKFQSKSNEFIYDFIEKPLRKDTVIKLCNKYHTLYSAKS